MLIQARDIRNFNKDIKKLYKAGDTAYLRVDTISNNIHDLLEKDCIKIEIMAITGFILFYKLKDLTIKEMEYIIAGEIK